MVMDFHPSDEFAKKMDQMDPLKEFRQHFHIPQTSQGLEYNYLCGNSLGLMPKNCSSRIDVELQQWAQLGVEGHFKGKIPWFSYHEHLLPPMALLVGALPEEVIVMNSLTTNLHLMMVSFYRPQKSRHKILIEGGAFPSDFFAVTSQLQYHGFDPVNDLIELHPRPGEDLLREEDILKTLEEKGEEVALVLLSGVQFRNGQVMPMEDITALAKRKGCMVGFDLAHAVGNVPLRLHDWGVDFAVWCTYKYLNAGPGGIGGAFVHENHLKKKDLPRFAGWWGHNKETRFKMAGPFDPIPTAESWQLSNPPILQLAALGASLDIFSQTNMEDLVRKSRLLTGYLNFLLEEELKGKVTIMTPKEPVKRGCQISLKIPDQKHSFIEQLKSLGIICDFRSPNILRVSPTPLYNRFQEVWSFVQIFREALR